MTVEELKRAGSAVAPDLGQHGRPELQVAWQKAFGSPPPAHLSLRFMRRALAHEAQCREYGDLSSAERRSLKAIAADKANAVATSGVLKPGAHLVREWNGRSYQVEVVGGGFRFDGKIYRSLTAIATRITGAKWSGPRFFGVT